MQQLRDGCSERGLEDVRTHIASGNLLFRSSATLARVREAVTGLVGRDPSAVADALARAMMLEDHHGWIRAASNELFCGSDALWEALCREWAEGISVRQVQGVIDAVAEAL